jgi:hypothetical protein
MMQAGLKTDRLSPPDLNLRFSSLYTYTSIATSRYVPPTELADAERIQRTSAIVAPREERCSRGGPHCTASRGLSGAAS